jgi:chorismate dehydratase
MTPRRRAGAPPDLVAAPLLAGLDRPPVSERLELSLAPAAELVRRIDAGELDLALLPATEIARRGGALEVVPGLAVTSEGPFGALLHVRVPLDKVTRVASTAPGHAAELLAATLFAASGRPVAIEPWPGTVEGALAAQGAVLLTGDEAWRWEPPGGRRDPQVIDLGAAWTDLTGLPMVWWAWAAPPGVVDRDTYRLLHSARTRGRRELEANAAQGTARGIPIERARAGLNCAVYRLGRRQLEGWRALGRAAFDHALLSQPVDLTLARLGATTRCGVPRRAAENRH